MKRISIAWVILIYLVVGGVAHIPKMEKHEIVYTPVNTSGLMEDDVVRILGVDENVIRVRKATTEDLRSEKCFYVSKISEFDGVIVMLEQ